MKTLVLLAAAAAAATLLAAYPAASSAQPSWADLNGDAAIRTVTVTASSVFRLRDDTRGCQRRAELPTSRASAAASIIRAGPGYRAWAVGLWRGRLAACRATAARTVPATGDWLTAVHAVQTWYPGSEWWLRECSRSEGGHGGFVWLAHEATPRYGADDTPGGWMQYKQGTFNGDFGNAVADLRARGVRVPGSASYYTPVGQAVAAGWAFTHGGNGYGKWTGGGCH